MVVNLFVALRVAMCSSAYSFRDKICIVDDNVLIRKPLLQGHLSSRVHPREDQQPRRPSRLADAFIWLREWVHPDNTTLRLSITRVLLLPDQRTSIRSKTWIVMISYMFNFCTNWSLGKAVAYMMFIIIKSRNAGFQKLLCWNLSL